MFQCRPNRHFEETLIHQAAPGRAGSRVRAARFSLIICGFLSPLSLSDFPSCAPTSVALQTRGLTTAYRLLFHRHAISALIFPASLQRLPSRTRGNSSSRSLSQANTLPSMQMPRIRSLSQIQRQPHESLLTLHRIRGGSFYASASIQIWKKEPDYRGNP